MLSRTTFILFSIWGLALVNLSFPIFVEAQAPAYRRPAPPTRDSTLEMRMRYMFAPDVNFQGLGNIPFRENYVQPGDPLTGAERRIDYDNGTIRQDYHAIQTEGGTVLVPTSDNVTGAFSYVSADQIRDGGNALAYHLLGSQADPNAHYEGNASSSMGWEISYTRYINRARTLGFQIAFSFNGFDSSYNDLITADKLTREFIHNFQPGQQAPALPPATEGSDGSTQHPPYQGPRTRPESGGVQIGYNPSEINESMEIDGAQVRSQMELRSSIFTVRMGPSYKLTVGQRINFNLGAGISAIYYDGKFAAFETLENADGGTVAQRTRTIDDDSAFQFGGYLDANAAYFLNQRVNIFSGVQYQGGSDYNQRNAEREVNVDFRSQIYLHTGIGVRF